MQRKLTPQTTIESLREEAKRRLKAIPRGDAHAKTVLRDVQDTIAREYGFPSWKDLKAALVAQTTEQYNQLADDFVNAYEGNAESLDRLNRHYERSFTFDDHRAEIWRRIYAFRQRSSREPKNYVKRQEAEVVLAQDAGFSSWDSLMRSARAGRPRSSDLYEIDAQENRIAPRRRLTLSEWDELIDVMRERRITALESHGLMSDSVLAKVAGLEQVTRLGLGGSRELTDDGLTHFARMPQLETLELSEYPGGRLTDRGLAALRHLTNLRRFEMTWQKGITDAGVANLRFCDRLEKVNVMGSATGDGLIEALEGKPALRDFSTGRMVTDQGLARLHGFPLLQQWQGGGARLLIDGPFTSLDALAGLDGVLELDLFWHVTQLAPDAFRRLAHLANLQALGCDGDLSGDTAMEHIAGIASLKRLRAQESAATEEGFVALSRSRTLEGFWGRQCDGFGSRAFRAFSAMPALRSLGVGCQKVEDAALATLPDFPSLRELTPIGFQDDGFRHIGRCPRLERLTCMYCRDTGDAATEHIAGLSLKHYYAGLTKITDASLEILGRMESLEQVDLYEVNGVTDAGLAFLAGLPKLGEVHIDSCPGVTLAGMRVFPERVRVAYTT
jgi:hypothetical protein